jgi:predicted restriction endonuclease
MKDAHEEYENQDQDYRGDPFLEYENRLEEIKNLNDGNSSFSIYDASDDVERTLVKETRKKLQCRAYYRSDDKIWSLFREIILPHVTFLNILKISPVNGDGPIRYYFRIYFDYFENKLKLPVHSSSSIKNNDKSSSSSNRQISQQKFKRDVHDYMPKCPFTSIKDERVLTASHIKPYKKCEEEGRLDEAEDPMNGLTLSPTYDRLFDNGYITFKDNGELICGTQFNNYTWSKLNINPNSKLILNIYPKGREKYLEYHRNEIFKDNIVEVYINEK